ncbi:MAG: methylmalonyl-CoA epimerase [Crocinitomicaceae bacterium]|jgi:methylmalonyl-CoA/ethylmalonyl-CoA epimerase|nr:methylmalonyl-CoA epimerase [Flavobacteriia bacterium]NDC27990.1 methylmalonyl-CoA epimerase [Crocinitomicaceae bacterium]NDC92618.1 methylmalonyl-CoA epimerase [Flavobacteriales bacterium]
MIKKIEHLGIAVNNLDEAIPLYEKLLQTTCYKTESVSSEGVNTAFFQIGEAKIELLEANNQNSPIAKFLSKRGEGFHHVAFEVDDIEEELARLQKLDFILLHLSPKEGADNKRIAFLHPKSTMGMLIELCQDNISKS